MKFKEPFVSFTGHRGEKRTTGTRNGSTGIKDWEKRKMIDADTVADATPSLRRRLLNIVIAPKRRKQRISV
ncbi:hypothetical protein Hanom_Chr00s099155g01803021 [Helianthus anomalus]